MFTDTTASGDLLGISLILSKKTGFVFLLLLVVLILISLTYGIRQKKLNEKKTSLFTKMIVITFVLQTLTTSLLFFVENFSEFVNSYISSALLNLILYGLIVGIPTLLANLIITFLVRSIIVYKEKVRVKM